ncbi:MULTISPECIES: MIP/aquaporin family protein [Leptolyngbya]|uniref:MIP/aquaporin family protein n=1 Tax=Leptolyngbya TaxID=47251 RepID=UPI0016824C5C|nr:aquaporin [Leptolyngbya sp. FACHB-1624]MBD1856000.1 aquaporin [Leptolyngbya sp. FACHB-1624]
MINTIRHHYPEYLMEAAGLGIFMVAAAVITAAVVHPSSPISQIDPLLQRSLIGIGMGLTAISLIYSPWGKQSGAHYNPAVTLTFLRLGKVKPKDAFCYVIAQLIGGSLGILIAAGLLGNMLSHPSVDYIVTIPGTQGAIIAFFAELVISFGLMMTVLTVSNTARLARWTGLFAGALVATYIIIEAPLSGMSMNPARTIASAIPANNWTAIWVYLTAPILGMFLASEIYVRIKGQQAVCCAKLHHQNHKRCIFRCGFKAQKLSDQLPDI